MTPQQPALFPLVHARPFHYPFPSTRYQGSKRKLVEWIWESVQHIEFDSVLDVFGGTGAVSHMFKNAGKQVIYNDILAFNYQIGLALIENSGVTLTDEDITLVLSDKREITYPNFIQKTFDGIYFTHEENLWLDKIIYNINYLLANPYKRALAYFALFQACIIKRPYNLFHRANLYMRTADVKRSFGNKVTWDTAFDIHFCNFVAEANRAVFSNGRNNQAMRCDALDTPTSADLVYIDPPYFNRKGNGVDYHDFYHFLEGIVNYKEWPAHIDYASKHRRLYPQKSLWSKAQTILDAFDQLVQKHRDSVLVVSYRDDGIPSKAQLIALLSAYKRHVWEASQPKQYALAHKKSNELLLIAV